jgi:mannose-1-phosphate guanylyltransferase
VAPPAPRAMILAAGLGTRLRPLTDELPKPLVPVGDRPAIAHVAARLAAAGIREAVLNTHHLAAAFTPDRLAALPLALRVIHEPEILGTAGGLANAAALLGDGDVVVWNGDILADVDVRALLQAHRSQGAAATLAVVPREDGAGTVGLDARGCVVRLRGERSGDEVSSADFLGIHVIGPELRATFPRKGCFVDDGYRPARRRGALVATFPVSGAWDDIGTVASYLAANMRWLAQSGRDAYVHETARVATGVACGVSVIGAGATVTGTGAVRGSVIWPGAHHRRRSGARGLASGSSASRGDASRVLNQWGITARKTCTAMPALASEPMVNSSVRNGCFPHR